MKRMTIRSLLLGVLLNLSTLPALAQKPPTAGDAKARLAKAEAMFQERSKKSGEFIHRTVENVDRILLLKIRGQTSRGDQYKMDDPYGHDSADDEFLKSFFLEPMLQANKYANSERIEKIRQEYRGYRYVDAIDPKDGKR